MDRILRLSIPTLAIVFSLLVIATVAATPSPTFAQDETEGQCHSREECRALRAELKEFTRELRPMRREMRQLRHQIRETPEGDERDALIAQARELNREMKRIRRERQPVKREIRSGCRRECFQG